VKGKEERGREGRERAGEKEREMVVPYF